MARRPGCSPAVATRSWALWFACRWEPAKDGVLIGFELGDNAVHLDTALLQREIDDLLAMAAGRLLWWQPRGISPRISAQQAAFVFGRVVDEPWGSIRLARGQVSLGNIGAVPGAAVVFVSARLKAALNGIGVLSWASARRACSRTSTASPWRTVWTSHPPLSSSSTPSLLRPAAPRRHASLDASAKTADRSALVAWLVHLDPQRRYRCPRRLSWRMAPAVAREMVCRT